jgi:hypothetical protein
MAKLHHGIRKGIPIIDRKNMCWIDSPGIDSRQTKLPAGRTTTVLISSKNLVVGVILRHIFYIIGKGILSRLQPNRNTNGLPYVFEKYELNIATALNLMPYQSRKNIARS